LAEVTSLRISDVHWAVLLCLVSQIGSYFGSVLTTIDINKDSYTDTLLIGAPMYMGTEKEEQGKVYVYTLNQVMVSEFGRNPGKSFPSLQF
jgi:integrin alpha 1